jgi:Rha family phage regulatory protein
MDQEKIPTRLKPRLKVIDGEITTTSLDVAEKFGKQHKDVLKAVRNLECSEEFGRRNFALVMETMTYTNSEGESVTKETSRVGHVRMTRNGFSILAMGFNGKAAMKWKEAYINAFSFMETRLVEAIRAMKQIEQHGMGKPLDFSDPDNLPALTPALFLRILCAMGWQLTVTVLIWWGLKNGAHKEAKKVSLRDIERDVGHVVKKSALNRAMKFLSVEDMAEVVANGRGVPASLRLKLAPLAERLEKGAGEGYLDQLFSDQSLTALAADLNQIVAH